MSDIDSSPVPETPFEWAGGEAAVAVTAPATAGDPAIYVVTVRWTEVGEAAPLQYQLRLTI